MRSKIVLVLILVFGFIYWRGSKALTQDKKLDCRYHIVDALCKGNTSIPSWIDVLKAGVKF